MNSDSDLMNPETIAAEPLLPVGRLNAADEPGYPAVQSMGVTVMKSYQKQTELLYVPERVAPACQLNPCDFNDTPVLTGKLPLDTPSVPDTRHAHKKITWLRSYLPVPQTKISQRPNGAPIWRIELCGLDQGSEPLGFDILDDTIIGRGSQADIRLDAYEAEYRGVSRRHALLRPTRQNLYVIDLGSTNGTFVNSILLGHATTRSINHDDVISLGGLSFALKIVECPPDTVYKPVSATTFLST